jgi:hypothetical protein
MNLEKMKNAQNNMIPNEIFHEKVLLIVDDFFENTVMGKIEIIKIVLIIGLIVTKSKVAIVIFLLDLIFKIRK